MNLLRTQTSGSFLKIAVILAAILSPVVLYAANDSVSLTFAPHCAEGVESCPDFAIQDAENLTTEPLSAGDILDLDIVLRSDNPPNIQEVRSWVKYDPFILEARSVDLTTAIQAPFPGEQTIDQSIGMIKIGGEVRGLLAKNNVTIARVTLRVLKDTSETSIAFSGFLPTGLGQVAVNGKRSNDGPKDSGALPDPPCFDTLLGCRGATTPLLLGQPSVLRIRMKQVVSSATSSSSNSETETAQQKNAADGLDNGTPLSSTQNSNVPTTASTSFLSLRIQGLRLATKNTDIFVAWQPLLSAELAGYNVYYGTVSGQYIQRRTLPSSASSLVLHNLVPDTTYFVAIRGFNVKGQETSFSQEASVTVGKPTTSTAPLSAMLTDSSAPEGNPVTLRSGTVVTGESGPTNWIIVFAFTASVIGISLAAKRHFFFSL